MNELEQAVLRGQLEEDEKARDRDKFDYTHDAFNDVSEKFDAPLHSIWPESNDNVARVIRKEIDYSSLPYDKDNEINKGVIVIEQQDIILRNEGKETLCEALQMEPCLEKDCELFRTDIAPPVCREFKQVYKK